MTLSRAHQTAVFVRTNPNASGKFRERAARLVESFNQPGNSLPGTIKADIYSVLPNGEAYRGLVWEHDESESFGYVGLSSPEMRTAAKAAGYAQSVVVDTTETETVDYTAPAETIVAWDDEDDYDDDEDDDDYAGYVGVVSDFTSVDTEPALNVDAEDDGTAKLLFDVLFGTPLESTVAATPPSIVINIENYYGPAV